jgi:poly-beta-1,6-N-acetyl-D-glucosamine synthase
LPKGTAGAFTIAVMVFITGVLALVFFYSTTSDIKLGPVMQVIYDLMLLYLIFSVSRTVVLVVLSFGEFFFRKPAPNPDFLPLVTVIIPCFNEEKVVTKAIESVSRLDYPNYEILVIDDGSTDLTLASAKVLEKKGRIRVIYQENTGKSGALNRAVSEALGEYVLCMDADSLLNPDVIRLGMAYFATNPKLAAVAGSVYIGNTPNLVTLFQKLEYIIGLNLHKTAQSFLKCVTIVPGPIGLFKKSAIIDMGGYHHDTFAEDCDLTIRMLMNGYEIVYCPTMIAVTEGPEDIRSLISQRYRWSRGIVQAISKHSGWLLSPRKNFRNFFILHYMMAESIIIPIVNFSFTLITLQHALIYGVETMLGPFFAGLTLLDMVLAMYCVATERQNVILVILAGVNRLTYGLALEIMRFFALIDELFKIPMNWGKLVRKGLST